MIFRTASFWTCVAIVVLNTVLVAINDDYVLRRLALLSACVGAVGALSHWLGLHFLGKNR